ncbi:MAG: PQQ-binding-like beta-propeller repeat protein [Candidatus Brocadiia bacterium]
MLALLAGAAAAGGGGVRPVDFGWPEDEKVRIEWKEEWGPTWRANKERWAEELKREVKNDKARKRRLALRLVRLLEERLRRHPGDPAVRAEVYTAIAEQYYEAWLTARGHAVLKRLVEEFPGRPRLAAPALYRVLERAKWHSPYETTDGPEWVLYASRRLLALRDAGYLPDSHRYVVDALRARATLRAMEGRWLEAWRALEALRPVTGRDEWYRLAEADLYYRAGRAARAQALYQEVHAESGHWKARDRLGELAADPLPSPPSLPSDFGLELRWESARATPLPDATERLERLLGDPGSEDSLASCGKSLHAAIWTLVDRRLLAADAESVAALRRAQEAKARAGLDAARGRGAAGLLALYRRHPWAASAHGALIEQAERALRRGQAGLALRSFRDVASHAAEPDLRAKARVGSWVALAQCGARTEELDRAFRDVPPDRPYPWRGGKQRAGAIREELAASLAEPPAPAPGPSLKGLERRALRVPPGSMWPEELFEPRNAGGVGGAFAADRAVVPHEAGVLVAGPRFLGNYAGRGQGPAWSRAPRGVAGTVAEREDHPPYATAPGRYRPLVVGGRVYTRWGLSRAGLHLTALAAFEADSGRMLWSTAGDPSWAEMWPVGEPALAGGRLYVLAVRSGHSQIFPLAPAHLVCLEAATGRMLWKRLLASQGLALQPSERTRWHQAHLDVVHYGNALAVHRGAVYCLTNLGFVARCDARDGMVEWLRTHPRILVRYEAERLVGREGAPPLVAGDRVLFMPRDRQGLFALECATGEPAWDRPLVPSQRLIGRVGGLVVLAGGRSLVGLEARGGEVAWQRRFDPRLAARPRLVGSSLYVATSEGLVRLDARTGQTLETAPWGRRGPPSAFALWRNRLVGLWDEPGSVAAPETGKPLNPEARTPGRVRLPLQEAWRLVRANPRLLVPPEEAGLDECVYLVSEGALECVRRTARGEVLWRRPVPRGTREIIWAEKLLILVFPRRLLALDATTGQRRWEREVPLRIRRWRLGGGRLFLAEWEEHHDSWRLCALELDSGELAWSRDLRALEYDHHDGPYHLAWDGKRLHLVARMSSPGEGFYDVVVKPQDGAIVAIRPFREGKEWPVAFAEEGGRGFYVDQRKTVYTFQLDGRDHTRHRKRLRQLDENARRQWTRIRGPWLQLYQYIQYGNHHRHWVLDRRRTDYLLERPRPGTIRGDRLYETVDGALVAIDLPSQEVAARYPVLPPPDQAARVLAFREEGDRVVVVSALRIRRHYRMRRYRVRVDLFEKSGGRPVASQTLEDVPNWRVPDDDDALHQTQVAMGKGVLLVTGPHGLRAFVPAAEGHRPPDQPVHVAHRVPRPVVVDGSLEEWELADAVPWESGGQVALAHDGDTLYLGVTCRDPRLSPRRGRGAFGYGDWLELGIEFCEVSHRLGVGLDAQGRPAWESLGRRPPPRGLRAGIRHDRAAARRCYELAIPLDALLREERERGWREAGLSLAAWDERQGQGPVRAAAWGQALEGRATVAFRHQRLYLHPETRDAEEAGLAIAHALPELPHAWGMFRRACRLRAAEPYSRRVMEPYADYLRRHPDGLPAFRALVSLDQSIRSSPQDEPTKEVLELARSAGVAEAVRRRYAHVARSVLRQWLYLDPKKPPQGAMVLLHDGGERYGWEHRVFWGHGDWSREGRLHTPSRRYAGPLPPAGQWHEMQVPLIWLDMHDNPLHGVSFWTQEGRAVWDRSALRAGGRDHVFLDDELPEGRREGSWRWVGEPRRSGAKAHTDAGSGGGRRAAWAFEKPLTAHLAPPLDGPYLSAWVWLDPEKPPRAVALGFYAHDRWRWRAVWGTTREEGRYMGELPRPGRWHELRVPLGPTAVGWRFIEGLYFEQEGGRVVWDRAAIVAGDQERVLVDDELPEGHTRGSSWEWVEEPVHSGAKAHTQEPRDDFGGHAVYGLRPPVSLHLPFRLQRAVAVLREHVPRLGPTEAAYELLHLLIRYDGAEGRELIAWYRWFLESHPTHPEADEMLARLLRVYRSLEAEDPAAAVEEIIDHCKLPQRARYTFHRKHKLGGETFIRNWLVVGPFPSPERKGHDTAFPPEDEPVQLGRRYGGAGGEVAWRLHRAEEDGVDLAKLFTPNEYVVAYATCWVQCQGPLFALIELGTDDGCKLWVNGKLKLDHLELRSMEPRQNVVPVYLRRGWNRLLLKVENAEKDWEFCVELVDREGRGLLDRVRLATTPPQP